MARAGRTLARQTTGRTKVLGVPSNPTSVPSAPNAGITVPGTQLNPQTGQAPSSITETGRSKDYGSAI